MTEPRPERESTYYSGFYPMHLGLLSVATNVMPIASVGTSKGRDG